MRSASALLAPILAFGLAFGAAAPRAHAQPGPSPAARARRERIKDRIKERIRALRAYTLTDKLGLDPATAGKLFPVLAHYDDEVDRLLEQRAALVRRLREADKLRDPRAIDHLIDQAIANQHALWSLEDQRLAQLRKILSPAQIARVLIVLPAFERKVERALQRAIRGRAGRRGRAPDPDLDDEDGDEDAAPSVAPRRGAAAPRARGPAPCDPFGHAHDCVQGGNRASPGL